MWDFVGKPLFTLFSMWPYNCDTFPSSFLIYLCISNFSSWNNSKSVKSGFYSCIYQLQWCLSQALTYIRHSIVIFHLCATPFIKKILLTSTSYYLQKETIFNHSLPILVNKPCCHSWILLGWALKKRKKGFVFAGSLYFPLWIKQCLRE